MGQYFIPINLDRQEYFAPPGAKRPVERSTHPAAGLLVYLLLSGPQDGTRFTGLAAAEYADGHPDIGEHEARKYGTEQADVPIAEANEYAGRWAGDRVMYVGDYAESGLYDTSAGPEWTNITEPLIEEYRWFLGSDEWPDSDTEPVLAPDMVFTATPSDDEDE